PPLPGPARFLPGPLDRAPQAPDRPPCTAAPLPGPVRPGRVTGPDRSRPPTRRAAASRGRRTSVTDRADLELWPATRWPPRDSPGFVHAPWIGTAPPAQPRR